MLSEMVVYLQWFSLKKGGTGKEDGTSKILIQAFL